MTIEIGAPDLEQRIRQLMDTGAYPSVEDLLRSALRTQSSAASQAPSEKQNFADFLLNSPLRGANLKIDRNKDEPRAPNLG